MIETLTVIKLIGFLLILASFFTIIKGRIYIKKMKLKDKKFDKQEKERSQKLIDLLIQFITSS